MEQLWENIQYQFNEYGPKIFAALIILIGFIIAAYVVKWLIGAAIDKTGLAKKANQTAGPGRKSLGASLSSAAFWVIILLGVIQALTRLELTTITQPLNAMLDEIFSYVPNIIAAVFVFAIFIIVANVVKQASKAVLVFADPLPEQVGFAEGPVNISGVVSTILQAFLMILGAIAAFDALNIESISQPVNALLSSIVDSLDNIILAGIILTVFVFVGRWIADLARKTLPNFGIDSAVNELGLLKGADRNMTASNIIANLALFFIVLLGVIQALRALEFAALTEAMNVVLDMGAQIVFGALIIFAGVFLARLITDAMKSAGSGATDTAASIVKWVIIVLSVILGISRMGLDPTGGAFILEVAKYIILGAALAIGIAFGWGGRDWAAAQLERFRPTK
ncbi:MAG: mechanosensitive ion channel [Alphaproteobacteria bacterium]|nr:mechanosensitive ion channel [Alphaproteobacteria bacterium]